VDRSDVSGERVVEVRHRAADRSRAGSGWAGARRPPPRSGCVRRGSALLHEGSGARADVHPRHRSRPGRAGEGGHRRTPEPHRRGMSHGDQGPRRRPATPVAALAVGRPRSVAGVGHGSTPPTLPRQRRQRFRLRAPSRTVDWRVAQRLACDATLTTLLHDSRGTPIDLGRRRRTVNHALRTALHLRDGGCRFPGWGHTRFVHAHHVVHWAHGGPTSLDNLLTLCTFHHRVVHDHDLAVADSLDGTLRFVDHEGAVFASDRVESTGSCRRSIGARAARGERVDRAQLGRRAPRPWLGDRCDPQRRAIAERRSRHAFEHAAAAASAGMRAA
jgi:hypothetical protein